MTGGRTACKDSSVYAFDTVASTNATAFDLCDPGAPHDPFWVTARRQTGGVGRRGRTWVSEAGNLYASLALRDPAPAAHMSELPFVAIVALHTAVCEILEQQAADGLAIKWPNDLLHDGAKLSGILVESRVLADLGPVAVIGLGVNCRHHPEVADYPATNLSAIAGCDIAPADVFGPLRGEMARALARWDRGKGFAGIRERWLALTAGLGRPITVRVATKTVCGVFAGIDCSGRLLVADAGGHQTPIAAGDVISTDGLRGGS